MKALLLDLYDTILDDEFFDFHAGLEYLHETYFAEECSLEDFLSFSVSFIPLYQDRNVTNKEVSFLKDEYGVYCSQLEFVPDEEPSEIEWNVMNHMQKESMEKEVPEILEYFHQKGIRLYIITNSIFTSVCHKRLLDEMGIGKYFDGVFSSTDFGLRKPAIEFYDHAVKEMMKELPDLKKEDITVIGNDFDADIQSAINAGLKAVWLNKTDDGEKHEGITTAKSLTELKAII